MEFFLHFVDQVERANAGKSELDPARSFKFGIEDRISCSSGKVAYNRRHDYILSLNIPLDEATNKGGFLSHLYLVGSDNLVLHITLVLFNTFQEK